MIFYEQETGREKERERTTHKVFVKQKLTTRD